MSAPPPLINLVDNPSQREFVFSPAKYAAYYGGIRNGKTWGGCYRGLILSQQFPGNFGLVGRLTYQELEDTTQKVFMEMVRTMNGGTLNPGPFVKRWVTSPNPELTLYNDSVIVFRHLDNFESILSMTLGWFYFDQAEFISEEVYNHAESRVNLWNKQTMAASNAKYLKIHGKPQPYAHKNCGFITGNPAPGWVHRRYKKNLKLDGTPFPAGRYHLVEAATDANVKNLPDEYLKDLRETQTEDWIKRYVAGSWDTFAGQIYKDYMTSLHHVPLMKIPDHWPRFLGWDHGTTNPTAVVFVCVDEDGNCIVYNEHYRTSDKIKEHAEAVRSLCIGDAVPRTDDGKGIVVWIDPAVSGDHDPEGRDFKQLYVELGIHGLNANKQVTAGIQKVASLLHPDPGHAFPEWHPRKGQKGAPRLYFMEGRCPATMHEIQLYEWEPIKEGDKANQREKPRKYLDHAMDALRYACMAIFEHAERTEKKPDPTYQEFVLADVLGINARLQEEHSSGIWDE